MGPGDGIQKQRLLDLPTTIETADQANSRVICHLYGFSYVILLIINICRRQV